jgi:E3 ubiquitin-protein ligase HECTD2
MKGKKVEEKGFSTGNCMVCDSLVKYPSNVKIFRCGGCLTVNDLEPIPPKVGGESQKGGHGNREKSSTYPGTGNDSNCMSNEHRNTPYVSLIGSVLPLSVDRTRAIIDRCIASYIKARLGNPTKETSGGRSSGEGAMRGTDTSKSIPIRGKRSNSALKPTPRSSPKPLSPLASQLRPSRSKDIPNSLSESPTSDDLLHPGFGSRKLGGKPPPPPSREPPAPPMQRSMENLSTSTNAFAAYPSTRPRTATHPPSSEREDPTRNALAKSLFRPLENYIIDSFGSFECLNSSFMSRRPSHAARARSESSVGVKAGPIVDSPAEKPPVVMSELDPKTLLIGDIGENGSWWSGRAEHGGQQQSRHGSRSIMKLTPHLVTHRSPRINWAELNQWYASVLNAGRTWRAILRDKTAKGEIDLGGKTIGNDELQDMDREIRDARIHTQRTLLKVTENLLKRPGRLLLDPDDARFLLIIFENPLLDPRGFGSVGTDPTTDSKEVASSQTLEVPKVDYARSPGRSSGGISREPGAHSGIIKRVLGLLANMPNECHRHLVSWFSRYSEQQFQRAFGLVSSFVTYRLGRQHRRKHSHSQDPTQGLIPNLPDQANSSAQLHAALGLSGPNSKAEDGQAVPPKYADDWQVKMAAKVMALLFSANNAYHVRRPEPVNIPPSVGGAASAGLAAKERARNHGQLLPTSDFYNSLLDYTDLIADFETWIKKTGKFTFCQYPFFLSIGAKIKILSYDTRKAMDQQARDAFFNSILTNRLADPYFHLRVRRDCLVDDSLRSISEAVGSGQDDIKKGLRVQFIGEEGIDAGGLRKEWFLLLVRDVFDPNYGKLSERHVPIDPIHLPLLGMFVYDDDSHFCYFNPNSFETSDQYFLVGAVLGLAIYNSTILDVDLPPFAFKKLLAAAPSSGLTGASNRPVINYTLEDLAEFRPALARGLRQLLEYDGDVEETFCRNFVAESERFGLVREVPLCPNGENRPVTNSNRQDFVNLYVRYLLDTAVSRQFEPFKRGFFTVCSGNALSLFRPEEIELLVRGSDEPLDVASVKSVAEYENWKDENGKELADPAEQVNVVKWFWEFFGAADAQDQRKILSFITGSDRIPAVGTTSLVIKISCLGDDQDRYPVARTCFNILQLYKYRSRRRLVEKLWRAVLESEGFGLK